MTAWTEFDPSIHWASQELFGIRGGRVLALSADGDRNVEGLFGAQEYALRDIAVDLPAEQVAGVTEDGTTVVVAPRGREPDLAPPAQSTVEIYRGTDVLRPAWDIYGQVWLVDRARSGATVVVRRGGVVAAVPAPGSRGRTSRRSRSPGTAPASWRSSPPRATTGSWCPGCCATGRAGCAG